MSTSTITQLGVKKDFEIIWVDRFTQKPRDLENVTFELYHYDEESAAELMVPQQEPYIITEDFTDTVNIGVFDGSGWIDKHFTLQLDIVATQLESMGCPPNDYTVPCTGSKISMQDGQKVYALSACELATLINLDASGYTAYAQSGFLVLKSETIGATTFIEVGNGTFNVPMGLTIGTRAYGTDTQLIQDINPIPMLHVDTGRYVYAGVDIVPPIFTIGERYYVLYKGYDPSDGSDEVSSEDFMVVDYITRPGLIYSFIK